ncbi:MAG: cupin domain-containing protein [Croceimicrobium sp.]|nr:cupin domain-containing protein [Bacteroidota bacterium]
MKNSFPKASPFSLKDGIAYAENGIVSKIISKGKGGSATLFAFDEGQTLSEHTAPFDALVYVLEGRLSLRIKEEENDLQEGQMLIIPANDAHALMAVERFKMLLTMFKA